MSFQVICEAGAAGSLRVDANAFWIRLAQLARKDNQKEFWESVAVEGKTAADGTLLIRIIVFNAEWEEPLQIAVIRSRPHDTESADGVRFELEHVSL